MILISRYHKLKNLSLFGDLIRDVTNSGDNIELILKFNQIVYIFLLFRCDLFFVSDNFIRTGDVTR